MLKIDGSWSKMLCLSLPCKARLGPIKMVKRAMMLKIKLRTKRLRTTEHFSEKKWELPFMQTGSNNL